MRLKSLKLPSVAFNKMTTVPKFALVDVPHNRLTFGEDEIEAVARAVRSGQWAEGPRVAELEGELARWAGVPHCVCVASGMAALRLALGALKISAESKVLVPAYSCVALANACLFWSATPIPVEIEYTAWNLDSGACVEAIKQHEPEAVIAVNTFGYPADLSFRQRSSIPVIEDCAHGFGLEVDGKPLGSRSEIGILSFYATKLLGGGEGGAVLTESAAIAEFVRSSRDYADQAASAHRMNDKMNDLEAALVLAQLRRLPEMIARREELALRYIECLSSSYAAGNTFRLPESSAKRIWYRFAVEFSQVSADLVLERLREEGVDAVRPVTDWRPRTSPSCPVADRAYRQLLSLPLYPTLTDEEQEHVVRSFLKIVKEH